MCCGSLSAAVSPWGSCSIPQRFVMCGCWSPPVSVSWGLWSIRTCPSLHVCGHVCCLPVTPVLFPLWGVSNGSPRSFPSSSFSPWVGASPLPPGLVVCLSGCFTRCLVFCAYSPLVGPSPHYPLSLLCGPSACGRLSLGVRRFPWASFQASPWGACQQALSGCRCPYVSRAGGHMGIFLLKRGLCLP